MEGKNKKSGQDCVTIDDCTKKYGFVELDPRKYRVINLDGTLYLISVEGLNNLEKYKELTRLLKKYELVSKVGDKYIFNINEFWCI